MADSMHEQFTGSITALVTPFHQGHVDEDAFVKLVHRQIEAGTHALVPVGTTGESPTLSSEEHCRVVSLCVEAAAGRVPVIAGAGSNNTAEAEYYAKAAENAGADAVLCVTGYYNKPSQEGLWLHFRAVHDATSLPVILYNIPGRTNVDIQLATMKRLSELERIIGVKDATGDLARVALQRLGCGTDFLQLSGEDMTAVGYNAMGGKGCISVTANVAPDLCAKMQAACRGGQWPEALDIQDQLAPLHDALFSDTSPGPVKYALSRMGFCSPEARLPIAPVAEAARCKVDSALESLNLL
ncbi:4-hydroxy-tetrahydrodipicolinate synthase [Parvularcula sp. IMCC14364]|uniref:4-hydroxy-tetrahydrodipicolinate synthase n=1 Tax=Parvularcula sp. IMCC14364 TaxID=3067902 RepID=UPI002740A7A4|nr:4-hydroxy-tetrahydrodipicolinate synthase [Parvularcula sp. IMCC14364]